MAGEPIDGSVLVLAGATASVAPSRLPDLVELVQVTLADERERYARTYERILRTDEFDVYLVEAGHWDDLGDRCGLDERETAAVRRAHREQLRWTGRRREREDEFDAALEIREPVVVGR